MKNRIKINNASLFFQIIGCIFILLLFPNHVNAQSYKSLVEKGNQLYRSKSYAEAQKYFSDAIKKKDNDLEIAIKLGECLWKCNKIYEANVIFSSISNSKNLPPSFYLFYGQSLRAAGNYREAKKQFQNYSQINPSIGDNFANSCDWALKNGNKSDEFLVSLASFNSKLSDFSPVLLKGKLVFSSKRNLKIQNFQIDEPNSFTSLTSQNIQFQGVNQPIANFSISSDPSLIVYSQINAMNNVRLIPECGLTSKLKWGNFLQNNSSYGLSEFSFSLNQDKFNYGYPFLSNDGNALYFSSDMEGGYGGMDLYVMYREGSNWTSPINLGPNINTQGDEISPFMSGNTLYFSSNWHEGFGGHDIFKVILKENEWSGLTNLGLPLNSPSDEFDFFQLGNTGYFTSNRSGGLGAEDIYTFKKKSNGILLTIVNALDGQPISDVKIEWGVCQPPNKPSMLSSILGTYNLTENLNTPCTLTFSKEGYSTKSVAFTKTNMDVETMTIPIIKLGEIYLGQVFNKQTKSPLNDVNVIAENLSNNTKMSAQSSSNGVFEFALKPNTSYNITFSKQGFSTFSKIIKTTPDGRDRTVLGESFISLETNSNSGEHIIPNKGLSIQIVALTNTPPSNQFSDLWNIADIYIKREDNQVKIRMGVFKSQEDALIALERVRQNGYPQAFMVEELNGPGFTNLVPVELVDIEKPQEINISKPEVKTTQTTIESKNELTPRSYKIQLVALRDTRFFDSRSINHLGKIQDYAKPNNITAKVIGDFTEENVRQILSEIRLAGFKDAYVVKDQNGVLIPVPNFK